MYLVFIGLIGGSVLESLFNKVAGLKAYNFIKKRLQQRTPKQSYEH